MLKLRTEEFIHEYARKEKLFIHLFFGRGPKQLKVHVLNEHVRVSHPSSMITPCMMMELVTLTFSFTVVEFPIVDLFMEVLSATWHRAPMILSDPI